MNDQRRARSASVVALLCALCLTVHCGKDATPNNGAAVSGAASSDGTPADGAALGEAASFDGAPAGSEAIDEAAPSVNGQSGSEARGGAGADTVGCPCGFPWWLQGQSALLRVTLLSREEGMSESSSYAKCRPSQRAFAWDGPPPLCARLRLRVEEVLHGAVAPEVGSEIEADSDGFLPCYWHLDGTTVGQQALAAASWPLGELPVCAARQECRDACVAAARRVCAPDAGDASSAGARCDEPTIADDCASRCEESFTAGCLPRPAPSEQVLAQGGSVQLTPWGDSIIFAETDQAQLSVPAGELPLLWGNQQQCYERVGDWAGLPGAFPGGVAP
jgi:hypothetical protein